MRAVKGSLGHSPKVRWRELEGPRLGEERVSARSGGRVRMGRAVEPNPTISHQSEDHPGEKKEGEGLRKFQAIVTAGLVFSLAACAGPEPLLRSNAKFQLQGREAAKLDVAVCQKKADAAGLKPGAGNRSGNVATGAGLGLIAGAAVGASSGLIGGVTGVAIGAAVGGALGVIVGSFGGAYKPLEPDPPYADAVVRCLIEKGYDVSGWQ